MSDDMIGTVGAILFVFASIILVRGLAALFNDCFGDWGARLKWKRERQPHSVRDQAVEAIAEDMVKNPDNWVSVIGKTDYGHKKETLRRADKRITLEGYTSDNIDYLQIDIDGLGKFNTMQIKPSLAKALKGICLAHKDYLALGVVLSPDKFILTER